MALLKSSIDREGVYVAEARVSEGEGVITFSLAAYTEDQGGGRVYLSMSAMDAEVLASMLLNAAIVRRSADEAKTTPVSMSEVETVYGRLLYAFRKECAEHGPGSTLAQEISTAIIVLEKQWPEDTKRYAERFRNEPDGYAAARAIVQHMRAGG